MRTAKSWMGLRSMESVASMALVAATALVVSERRADACGGCFHEGSGPPTQVSAHRMAFAISPSRTILWDQVQWAGDPTSFGWVLPIRGVVDVGVSSDQLFQRLEASTAAVITPPPRPQCEPRKVCRPHRSGGAYDNSATPTEGAGTMDGGVSVWSSAVVGPYEETQLSATDSNALRTWLKDHGYTLPASIAPIVDQYIKEGFGFLAIKLVPTTGTTRMVPIRIAFDGASPTLPLRMIAAGTGANVGIKLWILGEGRWEAKNFPNAEVKTSDLVWDFSYNGSNFVTLEANLVNGAPTTWVTETADQLTIASMVAGLPPGTETTDAGTTFTKDTDEAELSRAFPGRGSVTVSRLFAQLPSSALGNDLDLQASLSPRIPFSRQAPTSINACNSVEYVDCGSIDCAMGSTSAGGSSSTMRFLGLLAASVLGLGVVRRVAHRR